MLHSSILKVRSSKLALRQKQSSLKSLLRVLLIYMYMCHMPSWMFRRPLSLANWNGEENLIELCKSFMYKRRSRGPRTDPCGTPKLILSSSDEIPSIEMYTVCEIGFEPHNSLKLSFTIIQGLRSNFVEC